MRKLISAAVLMLPAVALANGYNVPNTNARDLALADSARAAQFSAAAAFANPSALAGIDGLNLSLGISFLDLRTDWKGPGDPEAANAGIAPNQASSMDFHPVFPPALFVSYGGKVGDHGWGVGAGWNIVAGGNVFYPADWAGRFRIIQVDRKVFGFYGTGGFELIPQIKIGGGVIYYRTTEDLIQGVQFGGGSEGTAELVAAGGEFSFDASVTLQPFLDVPLTIGVDYKHKADQKLTGNVHYTGVPPPLSTNPQLIDQNVTHWLTVPDVLNADVAFRVIPKLLLMAGFTWDNYSVYQEDVFQGDLGASVVVPRNYSDGYTIRLGAEYYWTPQLTVRAGLLRDFSGLNTSSYSPTLPDSNAWAGALGGAWAFTPDISLDLTVWYAHLDDVTATNTGPSPQAFPGTYSSHVLIASTALVWHDPFGSK